MRLVNRMNVMMAIAAAGLFMAGLGAALPQTPELADASRRHVKPPESRRFHFDYTARLNDIPTDAKNVRVWIPLPQTDENQTIERMGIQTSPPVLHRVTTEKVYGNSVAFFEIDAEQREVPESVEIVVSFDVTRHETSNLSKVNASMQQARLLGGDQLAPITDEVRQRALDATKGDADVLAKARDLYDRVLADVDYDKSGQGWGRGDIEYVCDAGKGNCSDFHTLFIGMSRSVEIPAFFEIGFPLPLDAHEGSIGGYHCWAWFQNPDGSWSPVDASEADKRPHDAEYFFGTICCNRVAFTRGRDLVLDPAPASGPVNFFVYPIVEIDGKDAADHLEKSFSFKDLPSE